MHDVSGRVGRVLEHAERDAAVGRAARAPPSAAPDSGGMWPALTYVSSPVSGLIDAEEQRDEPRARARGGRPARSGASTRSRRLEPLVDERAQHGEQQRHQQRRRAAFAGDVAERDHQPAVVAAAGCRRSRRRRCSPGRVSRHVSTPARCSIAARQHRQLDVARDLEVVLERQPIGDFQQDQQVHQRERRRAATSVPSADERPGTPRPPRNGMRTISITPKPRNRLIRPSSAQHERRRTRRAAPATASS